MTARIDHYAEMLDALELAKNSTNADVSRNAALLAQVHATAYAAEQQKVANKLAVALVEQLGTLAETNVQPGYPVSPAVQVRDYVTDYEWEGLS